MYYMRSDKYFNKTLLKSNSRNSSKSTSKFLLDSILLDARSTTGSNLRNILLLTDKPDVRKLVPNDAYQVKYHPIISQEEWRLPFIHEIIEAKNDQINILNIGNDYLDEMLDALCAR